MKRFLNLNDFGGKMILAIAIVGICIPLALYAVSLGLDSLGIHEPVLPYLIWGSLAVGAILLLGLIVLIVVEQIQDHLLYRMYLKTRGKRIRGPRNVAECPFCGNRNIREFELYCPVCGQKLL